MTMRKPWWMPEGIEIQQVIDLYESGKSAKKVVDELGLKCGHQAVFNFLRINNVDIRTASISSCEECHKDYIQHTPAQRYCKTCIPNQNWATRYKKYKITKPQFDEMWERQDGLCDLCFLPLPEKWSLIFVDHCHKQGHVRALLHGRCNSGLGFVENDKFMANAFRYIERHKR